MEPPLPFPEELFVLHHPTDVLGLFSNCITELKHFKKTHVGVLCLFLFLVLASFRGTVQHGLPLEIGDTVQILEKCEGTVH